MPIDVTYADKWSSAQLLHSQLARRSQQSFKKLNTTKNIEALIALAAPRIQTKFAADSKHPTLSYTDIYVMKGFHYTSQTADSDSMHITISLNKQSDATVSVTLHLSVWLGLGCEAKYGKGEFKLTDLKYASYSANGSIESVALK